MSTENEWGTEDRELALRETREKLAVIEREWKFWRQQSRQITVELITIDKFSVAKAAAISGHSRQTISTWLQIHNAEQKGRESAK